MKISVFDDDPLVLQVLVMSLQSLGHTTSRFEAWPEDTGLIEESDLVLTDINMPLLNGYEILRRVKQIGSHIRVIAVTADQELASESPTGELHFDRVLRKPYSLEDLETVLSE